MDFVPFDTVGLTATDFDNFYQAYQKLKEKFSIQPTGNIDFRLNDFEAFKNYTDVKLRGSFVIKQENNDCYILFVEVQYQTSGKEGFSRHSNFHIWSIAYLKHDFGRVMIRRETLVDKVVELVHPVELDFSEDKAFSDTFYVLVNDHEKAVTGITRLFRNAVMDVRCDDFLIEIIEHTLLIGSNQSIVPEKVTHLAEFIERVAELC